ncbi:2Fe-2S ferredoxin [Ruegeria sp. ANG-S4]|uniref:DUF1284 domain-containing protein n=1 Tax=Ruegeria sp. ANG-S4 TaxID=1577904 RepID=UPI00057F6571|nr:DUF1284 domain-containing protein [Ruegeria sp. ANG-S4]KIC45337.1 2Fe-2S ferredoxin [Ruegeria sp. ANG-S4]
MTVRLRAHHLLCILTYVGKGYSPAFTNNMTAIAGRISAGESIVIVEGPDDICAPLLAEDNAHCRDEHVHNRDLQAAKDVNRVLQVQTHAGAKIKLDKGSLLRLRTTFTQNQLRPACIGCKWGDLCTSISLNDYKGTFV